MSGVATQNWGDWLSGESCRFYERYGWEFFCQVQGDDGKETRVYIHKTK